LSEAQNQWRAHGKSVERSPKISGEGTENQWRAHGKLMESKCFYDGELRGNWWGGGELA